MIIRGLCLVYIDNREAVSTALDILYIKKLLIRIIES